MRVEVRRGSVRALLLIAALAISTLSGNASAQQKAAAPSSTKPSFDELYSRGQKANASIKTLTARFTEKTSNPLLTSAYEERGVLYVQRPDRVVMLYEEPAGKVILIDGKNMTMVIPSQKQRLTKDVGTAQGRVQRLFRETDANALKKEFDIQVQEKSERPGTYEVSMTARRRQIRENLARLELWVPETTGLLEAMRITFTNGQTKTMEFRDVVPDAAIDPAVFTLPK